MTDKIDYSAIIADLESKRAALDNAIASLKAVASFGAIGTSEGTSYVNLAVDVRSPSASGGDVPDGAFHGKSIPAAIKLYLNLVNKKQSAREIADGLRKGGMESTSKFFEKIVYATLDRLRKAGEVVKIEGNWALPQWYPALMRAGIGENGHKPKRRGRPRKTSSEAKGLKPFPSESKESKPKSEPQKIKNANTVPGPSDTIWGFLLETPGPHTTEEIRAAAGIDSLKLVGLLLGQLVKKGRVQKTEDGKYQSGK